MGNRRMGLGRMEALLEALDRDLDLTNTTLTQVLAQSQAINLVADATGDTTITSLDSGKDYHFGTVTGAFGAADGDNATTFKLPTPTYVGERIMITATNASNIAKAVGVVTSVPATQKITYFAMEAGAGAGLVETDSTATGAAGTQTVFVKINGSTLLAGDRLECVAMSTGATAEWYLYIHSVRAQLAAGDIAPAAGNAGGYIA